ncbi:hypothetical protein UFOVP965_32 [uncultured Caudovirales phage]|uniref:Uncharacterized protein n=1 Tax=uncultured Caudovirales phage TaxID=2100421 RepID=A0A6J5Q6N6_9CAUD|nr:hypothetical protein UFOVP965_32 [uncultured Caudovirales phage]CAB4179743.1 hypothetical protein UFOVP1035_28 [uncultured Caudovirales phage]CAB4188859.1 hypothetical protein UFOVP1181_134 [uncultured Caudovirales phage]
MPGGFVAPRFDPKASTQVKPTISEATPTSALPGVTNPTGYKFNLPPHNWSLPVDVRKLQKGTSLGSNSANSTAAEHGLRRGRIWYYYNYEDVGAFNNVTAASTIENSINNARFPKANSPLKDTTWGFQFLWNPESITTAVNINMDVTPSNKDRFRAMSGVFPGQEQVSLNILLDRTNDFACIKSGEPASSFINHYTSGFPGSTTTANTVAQIGALQKLGTMADIEYLFRTVNTSGPGKNQWANLLGKPTADIGYIQPSIIAMQLGPDINSISYVGWINSLQVTHTAFTEQMIPIRSSVSISIQCVTGTGMGPEK